MEVVSTDDVGTAEALDGAFLSQLASGDRMSVQRYRIEPGVTVDEHGHHHEQVGYLCSGVLTFVTGDGEEFEAEAGSAYAISGTSPTGRRTGATRPPWASTCSVRRGRPRRGSTGPRTDAGGPERGRRLYDDTEPDGHRIESRGTNASKSAESHAAVRS